MKYLHTMVRVKDLEESLDFYCNKLGLEEIRRYDSKKGRFTLVFLAAPDDVQSAKEKKSPVLELTYNWDPEEYDSARNFGHLAFEVDDIYNVSGSLVLLGPTPSIFNINILNSTQPFSLIYPFTISGRVGSRTFVKSFQTLLPLVTTEFLFIVI